MKFCLAAVRDGKEIRYSIFFPAVSAPFGGGGSLSFKEEGGALIKI